MNEKKPPADILDEIMNRWSQPLPSPVSYPPKFDPPPPEDTPQPPAAKRSPLAERLLPWLGALLGGAVLALILCGIQLFSVNARLDGLQANLEEIQTMDELTRENDRLRTAVQAAVAAQQELLDGQDELKQRRDELAQIQSELANQYAIADWSHRRAAALSLLERFCAQEDWLMAACVVEDCDPMFNTRNRAYGPAAPLPAVLSERYLLLRDDVMEYSQLMTVTLTDLDPEDPEHAFEKINLYPANSPYGQKAVEAARELWFTLQSYCSEDYGVSAVRLAAFCDPELGYRAELEDGGAFQPDTVELFRQMLDDLSQLGLIQEHEDGTMATTGRTVDGSPAFVLD